MTWETVVPLIQAAGPPGPYLHDTCVGGDLFPIGLRSFDKSSEASFQWKYLWNVEIYVVICWDHPSSNTLSKGTSVAQEFKKKPEDSGNWKLWRP